MDDKKISENLSYQETIDILTCLPNLIKVSVAENHALQNPLVKEAIGNAVFSLQQSYQKGLEEFERRPQNYPFGVTYEEKWKNESKKELLLSFSGSYFNDREYFVADDVWAIGFPFAGCDAIEEVQARVLENFSRFAYKGEPAALRDRILNGINHYLGTCFSKEEMGEIYEKYGNGVNHSGMLAFIQNDFCMEGDRQEYDG